jgi:selenocysteine lyase/cysteine desulfurase
VRPFIEAKARRPVSLGAMLEQKETVRSQFAQLVGASPDEIGFLSATSDGENVIARALDLKPGDNVVLDELHFSTSYILYSHLAETLGIELRLAPARDGAVPTEAFEPLVDDRTRLISVAWVSHQNGFLHDVDGLAALAHAHGAYLYADAIQAAGMVPIDVRRTPIDCFACGTYKWLLGGFGIAHFFVRRSLLDRVPPDRLGFLQVERELGNHQYELFTTAKKFEYATPAFGAFYELGAGLAYLERVGVDRIHAHGVRLAHRMRRGLVDLGVSPVTPEGNQSAIVAFPNPTDEPTAASVFDQAGIQVTFRESGRRIRMGAALFNTDAEVDRLLEAVERLI